MPFSLRFGVSMATRDLFHFIVIAKRPLPFFGVGIAVGRGKLIVFIVGQTIHQPSSSRRHGFTTELSLTMTAPPPSVMRHQTRRFASCRNITTDRYHCCPYEFRRFFVWHLNSDPFPPMKEL